MTDMGKRNTPITIVFLLQLARVDWYAVTRYAFVELASTPLAAAPVPVAAWERPPQANCRHILQ